ncbi:hypothetical protein N2152v2_002427 [Parachlorella kessleri]
MTASSVPTVELLDVDNYATWRSKMKFLLITKGLWAAVVAYETVVTVLETSSTEDVKLDDILPKLMSVEQRMYVTKSPGPSEAALAAAAKRRNDFGGAYGQRVEQRTCYACGQVTHIARFCRNQRRQHQIGSVAL